MDSYQVIIKLGQSNWLLAILAFHWLHSALFFFMAFHQLSIRLSKGAPYMFALCLRQCFKHFFNGPVSDIEQFSLANWARLSFSFEWLPACETKLMSIGAKEHCTEG